MAFCTKCGKEVPQEASFCADCGAARYGTPPSPPVKQSSGIRTQIVGGVIGLIACLLIIGRLISMKTPAPDPDAAPTVTSAPTPGLQPTLDPRVYDYMTGVEQQVIHLDRSWKTFSELAANMRPYSIDWKISIAEQVAVWQDTFNDASNLAPPTQWEDWNARYDEAVKRLAIAGDAYTDSIDASDGLEMMESRRAIEKLHRQIDVLADEARKRILALEPQPAISALEGNERDPKLLEFVNNEDTDGAERYLVCQATEDAFLTPFLKVAAMELVDAGARDSTGAVFTEEQAYRSLVGLNDQRRAGTVRCPPGTTPSE
jgi:hypothetical protein